MIRQNFNLPNIDIEIKLGFFASALSLTFACINHFAYFGKCDKSFQCHRVILQPTNYVTHCSEVIKLQIR